MKSQLASCLFLSSILLAQTYRVEHVAGLDHDRMGEGTSVLIRQPADIVAGPNGSFFVSDSDKHRVLRIAADYTVSLVAGTGQCCVAGDGGLATAASIGTPVGLAYDSIRNRLYIAQPFSGRVRVVELSSGLIRTYAGSGPTSYNVAIENRSPSQATISPRQLAVDSGGTLFIADEQNRRIYRVDPSGASIRTFAGNGTEDKTVGYNDGPSATNIGLAPRYLADAGDGLIVNDGGNMRRIEKESGAIRTVVRVSGLFNPSDPTGGFSGPLLALQKPYIDGTNLLTPSVATSRVYRFQANGSLDLTELGTFITWRRETAYDASGGADPDIVKAIAIQNGRALGIGNGEGVKLLSANGNPRLVAGVGLPGLIEPVNRAFLVRPEGIAVLGSGEVAIADTGNARVRILSSDALTLSTPKDFLFYTSANIALNNLLYPRSVAHGNFGEVLIGTDQNVLSTNGVNGPILRLAGANARPRSGFSGDGGLPGESLLSDVRGVARTPSGGIVLADYGNRRVRYINPTRTEITTIAGNGQVAYVPGARPTQTGMSPSDVAIDSAGSIFIADDRNHRIYRLDMASNTLETVAGTGQPGFSGDQGAARSARVNGPTGIAVSAQKEIFVADNLNARIRRIGPDGAIRTIAGNGQPGNSGDGKAALEASLVPAKIAVAPNGDLYLSDTNAHRVRRLVLLTPASPPPQISAGGVLTIGGAQTRAAAGSLISIYGSNLSSTTASAGSLPQPDNLGGVIALMLGRPMALSYVSPTQINAQVPNFPAGRYPVTIYREEFGVGQVSNTVMLEVVDSQPDVLTYGTRRAVAIDVNGNLIGPLHPAQRGSIAIVFLTGIGPTIPQINGGQASPTSPLAEAYGERSVSLGGVETPLLFLGLTPGFVGLAQANIQIPPEAANGDQELIIRLRGASSNSTVLAIE